MKMYMIYSRPIPGCCKDDPASSLIEIECEKVTQMEDVSIGWLPPGEFKVRVIKPEFLYEPREVRKETAPGVFVKEKIMEQPVYYGHHLYQTLEEAREKLCESVVNSFEFEIRKGRRTTYSEEEVTAIVAKIKEVLLP